MNVPPNTVNVIPPQDASNPLTTSDVFEANYYEKQVIDNHMLLCSSKNRVQDELGRVSAYRHYIEKSFIQQEIAYEPPYDVQAIVQAISTAPFFRELQQTVNDTNQKVTNIDHRLSTMEAKLNSFQDGFDKMDTRLDGMERGIETRLEGIQDTLGDIQRVNAKTYNATCGDGQVRAYEPVPARVNGIYQLPPPHLTPLTNMDVIRNLRLNVLQLEQWLEFYGDAYSGERTYQQMLESLCISIGCSAMP